MAHPSAGSLAIPWNTQRAIAGQYAAGVPMPQIARDESCSIEQVASIVRRAERHSGGIVGFVRQTSPTCPYCRRDNCKADPCSNEMAARANKRASSAYKVGPER